MRARPPKSRKNHCRARRKSEIRARPKAVTRGIKGVGGGDPEARYDAVEPPVGYRALDAHERNGADRRRKGDADYNAMN